MPEVVENPVEILLQLEEELSAARSSPIQTYTRCALLSLRHRSGIQMLSSDCLSFLLDTARNARDPRSPRDRSNTVPSVGCRTQGRKQQRMDPANSPSPTPQPRAIDSAPPRQKQRRSIDLTMLAFQLKTKSELSGKPCTTAGSISPCPRSPSMKMGQNGVADSSRMFEEGQAPKASVVKRGAGNCKKESSESERQTDDADPSNAPMEWQQGEGRSGCARTKKKVGSQDHIADGDPLDALMRLRNEETTGVDGENHDSDPLDALLDLQKELEFQEKEEETEDEKRVRNHRPGEECTADSDPLNGLMEMQNSRDSKSGVKNRSSGGQDGTDVELFDGGYFFAEGFVIHSKKKAFPHHSQEPPSHPMGIGGFSPPRMTVRRKQKLSVDEKGRAATTPLAASQKVPQQKRQEPASHPVSGVPPPPPHVHMTVRRKPPKRSVEEKGHAKAPQPACSPKKKTIDFSECAFADVKHNDAAEPLPRDDNTMILKEIYPNVDAVFIKQLLLDHDNVISVVADVLANSTFPSENPKPRATPRIHPLGYAAAIHRAEEKLKGERIMREAAERKTNERSRAMAMRREREREISMRACAKDTSAASSSSSRSKTADAGPGVDLNPREKVGRGLGSVQDCQEGLRGEGEGDGSSEGKPPRKKSTTALARIIERIRKQNATAKPKELKMLAGGGRIELGTASELPRALAALLESCTHEEEAIEVVEAGLPRKMVELLLADEFRCHRAMLMNGVSSFRSLLTDFIEKLNGIVTTKAKAPNSNTPTTAAATPTTTLSSISVAWAWIVLGDFEAAHNLAACHVGQAKSREKRYLLGVCEYYNGRTDEAARILGKIVSETKNHPAQDFVDSLHTLKSLRKNGVDLHKKGCYETAIERFRDILNIDPLNTDCHHKMRLNMASALLKLGKVEEAVSECTAVLVEKPTSVKALFRRHQCYRELKRWREAREDLELALARNPDKLQLKRALEALKEDEQLGQVEEKRLDYYQILGIERFASGKEIKKAYYKLALQWHPDKHQTESKEKKRRAEEHFKNVTEAYQTLSNPEERGRYDECDDEQDGSDFCRTCFNQACDLCDNNQCNRCCKGCSYTRHSKRSRCRFCRNSQATRGCPMQACSACCSGCEAHSLSEPSSGKFPTFDELQESLGRFPSLDDLKNLFSDNPFSGLEA